MSDAHRTNGQTTPEERARIASVYLNRLRRGCQRPQTIIVNESWWTPTARNPHIVLPATTTLERNDIGSAWTFGLKGSF